MSPEHPPRTGCSWISTHVMVRAHKCSSSCKSLDWSERRLMSPRPTPLPLQNRFMPYRIPHRAITAVLGGAFLLVAQTSFRSVGQVQASGPTTGDARLLVQEEARAVQSIDHFVVAHQVDITSVTPHYNQTTHAYVKTWVQRPGHVRAESQQYTRSEMIVSDGSTTWIYDGGHRIYWRQSRGAPAALFSNA